MLSSYMHVRYRIHNACWYASQVNLSIHAQLAEGHHGTCMSPGCLSEACCMVCVCEAYQRGHASHASSSLTGSASISLPFLQDAAGPLGQAQSPGSHFLLVSIQLMLHLALLVLWHMQKHCHVAQRSARHSCMDVAEGLIGKKQVISGKMMPDKAFSTAY